MTDPWVRAERARPQVKQASAASSFRALQGGQIMVVAPDCVPECPHPASPPPSAGIMGAEAGGIGMSLRSVNPTDGSLVREYAETPPGEVASALAAAARAVERWARK